MFTKFALAVAQNDNFIPMKAHNNFPMWQREKHTTEKKEPD